MTQEVWLMCIKAQEPEKKIHFSNFSKTFQPPPNTKDQPIYLNKAVIKCMITVAECIRINNLNTMNPTELNYMHVSKAAQYCEAYFTSIMYAELWALQVEATTQYSLAQIKSETNLQELMKKVSEHQTR